MDVGTRAVACFHGEVLGDRCLEAGGFDGDGVMSDRKKREAVVAGAVGLVVRFSLVPRLVRVMVALGTTAPVASVTVPRMSAVVSCAKAAEVNRSKSARKKTGGLSC